MKARALTRLTIRVERWEGSAGLEKESASKSAEGGPSMASTSNAWPTQLVGGGGVSFQIHRPEKMVLIIDSHTDNEIQPEL